MGDTRHSFIQWYLYFVAIYLVLNFLAGPILGQIGDASIDLENATGNYTWNETLGDFVKVADPVSSISTLWGFGSGNEWVDAIIIGPAVLFLGWTVGSAVLRGA